MSSENQIDGAGRIGHLVAFGRFSISTKLVAIIMTVSAVAMLIAGSSFVMFQVFAFRDRLANDLATLATMVGDNCNAAFVFDDPVDAQSVLESLAAQHDILKAYVFNADGSVFASYGRPDVDLTTDPQASQTLGLHFEAGRVAAVHPIFFNHERIGTVYLVSSLDEMYAFVRHSAAMLLLTIVIASIIAYALSTRLQRFVSDPVAHLGTTARSVTESRDYSVRAPKETEDELGDLTDAFNEMLAQIQMRDGALRQREEEARRFNASLQVLHEVSTQLSEADSVDALCRLTVELGKAYLGIPRLSIWLFDAQLSYCHGTYGIAEDGTLRDERDQRRPIEEVRSIAEDIPLKFEESCVLHDLEGHPLGTATRATTRLWDDHKTVGILCADDLLEPGTMAKDLGEVLVLLASSVGHILSQKRSEVEMQKLRNLMSNIIDSMPSVLVGVDKEGCVTQWNREAQRITGIAPTTAHGQRLDTVLPELADEMPRVHAAIQSRQAQEHLKMAHEIEGEKRYADVTVYPLIADAVEGAVIRIDDVTNRVRIEEMMIQSEKMLSVGGLAAGMAHEINNPLAGILQNAQVLLNRFSPELAKNREAAQACGTSVEVVEQYMQRRGMVKMVQSIVESGKRAATIVENMLSFSRKGDAPFPATTFASSWAAQCPSPKTTTISRRSMTFAK